MRSRWGLARRQSDPRLHDALEPPLGRGRGGQGLVLGEAIGDLAGAKLAQLAYTISRRGRPPAPALDGFTPEQQFFVAWGQFRGDAIRPETQRLMVQGDPHPIAEYRVIGPLANLAAFQEAFGCKPGAPMLRPADRRCEIW